VRADGGTLSSSAKTGEIKKMAARKLKIEILCIDINMGLIDNGLSAVVSKCGVS
jgi:hypothetical protein